MLSFCMVVSMLQSGNLVPPSNVSVNKFFLHLQMVSLHPFPRWPEPCSEPVVFPPVLAQPDRLCGDGEGKRTSLQLYLRLAQPADQVQNSFSDKSLDFIMDPFPSHRFCGDLVMELFPEPFSGGNIAPTLYWT